jgi:hypothetical protein
MASSDYIEGFFISLWLLSNVDAAVQEALALKLVEQQQQEIMNTSDDNTSDDNEDDDEHNGSKSSSSVVMMIEIHPLGADHLVLVSPVQIAAILLQSIRLAANVYLCPSTIRKKSLQIPIAAALAAAVVDSDSAGGGGTGTGAIRYYGLGRQEFAFIEE